MTGTAPPIAEITVDVPGPFAIHNMPCTVCREKHAVLDLNRGVMEPCWSCQADGYQVLRRVRFLRFLHRWVEA